MAKQKIFTKKNFPIILGSVIGGAGLMYFILKPHVLKNLLSDSFNTDYDPYYGQQKFYSTPIYLPEADKAKKPLNPDDMKMQEPAENDMTIAGVNR